MTSYFNSLVVSLVVSNSETHRPLQVIPGQTHLLKSACAFPKFGAFFFFFFLMYLFFMKVGLICSIVPISAVQHGDHRLESQEGMRVGEKAGGPAPVLTPGRGAPR